MEWTVVTVIVVLIGLVGALIKPFIKLNTTLTENTMAIKAHTKTMERYECENKNEHKEIWQELDKHDERITKVEYR